MILINERKMLKETKKYNKAGKELEAFKVVLKNCKATCFREFKEQFPSADRVGDKEVEVCIDINRNVYRLIIKNYYGEQRTVFKEFLTHDAYMRKYRS
ncbi:MULTISPECIES: type II toxin-antitoxin system HigB family toxin [unclassified Oceanispirochaeta]|uniref:type II toxin-antitoxin system HigB family toxin n=1 Tax=unclassified Oceanispirochaeta TaxID=2635722 RepID=UPI0013142BF5|nr:type II toxin-antitoxin system HigB family toxin [Oceanispirochaeta sp. M1]MBF9015833.1 type II toxin-antitoxin system HigB family toxin [Oceanispirochaeta sp. M2]NPD72296.1 hypothetical protein [Oceanispirochaeta sp. M1]